MHSIRTLRRPASPKPSANAMLSILRLLDMEITRVPMRMISVTKEDMAIAKILMQELSAFSFSTGRICWQASWFDLLDLLSLA
jgi:hypothetical protein